MESEAWEESGSVDTETCLGESVDLDLVTKGNRSNFEKESVLSNGCVAMEVDTRIATDGNHCADLSESASNYKGLVLECPICKLLFANEMELKHHTLTHFKTTENTTEQCDETNHAGDQSLECSICFKTFSLGTELADHMLVHTGKKPYGCHECDKTFPQLKSLMKHLKNHNKKTSYNCSVCEKTFMQRQALTAHERTHNGERPFRCGVCEKTFADRSNLKRHMRVHNSKAHGKDHCRSKDEENHEVGKDSQVGETREKPDTSFKCSYCGKDFIDKSDFTKHKKMWHSNELVGSNTILNRHTKTAINFECSVCGKSFGKKLDLVCHEGIHTGERPHVCVICDKGFLVRRDLLCHNRKVHQNKTCPENVKSNETFTCTECRKEFARKGDLTQHIKKKHAVEASTRFQCAYCEEEFIRKSDLICHEGTHTGGTPVSCFNCDETFTTEVDLRKHTQLQHPIDSPAPPSKDEKSQHQQIEQHMDTSRNISESFKFKCKDCEKSFARKADLSCHEGIHTGKRPHLCEICGKAFATKPDLSKHEKRTHSKNFTCSLCDKGFGIKSDLERHMKSHEKSRLNDLQGAEPDFCVEDGGGGGKEH